LNEVMRTLDVLGVDKEHLQVLSVLEGIACPVQCAAFVLHASKSWFHERFLDDVQHDLKLRPLSSAQYFVSKGSEYTGEVVASVMLRQGMAPPERTKEPTKPTPPEDTGVLTAYLGAHSGLSVWCCS